MNNNTISWKSINPKAHGIGLHRKFRREVNKRVHAVKFIINRVDITWNKQTKRFDEDCYLAIVDDSPMIREFGFDADYRKSNVLVFDVNDEEQKDKARRINIDGMKYIYCTSVMVIKCDNKKKINELADKGYMLDGSLYMAATASPSNEKHSCKYFAQINDTVVDEEAIFNKIDKLMGGALSDKLMSKPVDGKAVTKSNTRIGNYASGMQCFAKINLGIERVAVISGSMFQDYDFDQETREEMESVGVEIDNHINDGAALLHPAKIVEIASELGIRMTEDDAMRIAIQTRWDGLNTKVMAQVRRPEVLADIADFYKADVYGNPNGPIVAVVDEDGAKMINYSALKDGATTIDMYVMAVANTSGVQSCSQHMIKYMAVDPERTLELVNYHATLAMDDFVANKFEADNGGFSVNGRIMAKLQPEEIYEDAFLMETIYQEAWTYAQSMIANNKMPLDGVYTHMTFDMSYAMTRGLVTNLLNKTAEGFIEAYSPDVVRIYADEIEAIESNSELTDDEKQQALFELLSGTVVKFPSAMPDEYEVIVYLTEEQMKQRIEDRVAALECDNETKAAIKDTLEDYIEYAPYGCTIYAPVNAMKNKLAGADIDYDATMCDMSMFKFILINKRIEEAQAKPGYMGKCTFIKYGKVTRDAKEQTNEVFTEVDDIDM